MDTTLFVCLAAPHMSAFFPFTTKKRTIQPFPGGQTIPIGVASIRRAKAGSNPCVCVPTRQISQQTHSSSELARRRSGRF